VRVEGESERGSKRREEQKRQKQKQKLCHHPLIHSPFLLLPSHFLISENTLRWRGEGGERKREREREVAAFFSSPPNTNILFF
jgi:hypothetical protein